MQYAIIQTGGKQYQAEIGKPLEVELLDVTDTVTFDQVLLVVDGDKVEIGAPTVKGVVVTGKVLEAVHKGEKIDILRYKSKSRYRKHTGHRQKFTKVMIESIGDVKVVKPVKVEAKVEKKVVEPKPVAKKTVKKVAAK